MRLLGYILMTIGLCVGTLAATTAYVPRIGAATEGLTLNAIAGIATPDAPEVVSLAAWLPEAAHEAAAAIRDERRGRPRIETRFSTGAGSTTTLDHPGDLGLIVLTDEAGFAPLLPKLGDSAEWPAGADMAVIVVGLSGAQVDEILSPETEEAEQSEEASEADPADSQEEPAPSESTEPADDDSASADEGPRGFAVTDGILIPVVLPEDLTLPSLADLSPSDRYTLAATLALPFTGAQATRDAQQSNADPSTAGAAVFMTDPEGRFIVAKERNAAPNERTLLPLAQPKDMLTAEFQAALIASGTQRVRVKEFSFARWEHSWVLGIAVAILLTGVFLVRSATKKLIAESVSQASSSGVSPADALDRIVARLDRAAEGRVCGELLPQLTDIQRDDIPVILDARNMLIGAMGLKGYAEFMDVFSSMERQINRAWSASADDVFEEAITAVNTARAIAPDVMDKVRSIG